MSKTPWYSIRTVKPLALAAAGVAVAAAAEIYIYGDIGESWYGDTVTAAAFVQELNALEVDAITIRINSIGGSVQDGIAIYNAIKRHQATVTVAIDSLAASIASLIAMAGDTVEMADNAMLMIHAPWAGIYGNANELRDMADMLDQFAAAMATSYAAKTGRPVDEMLAWLTDGKDHWFTAADALAEKLIDSTTTAMPIAASANKLFDLTRFRNLPAALARRDSPAAAAAPQQLENPMPGNTTTTTAAAPDQAAIQAAQQSGAQAEAKRRADIRAALTPFAAADKSFAADVKALIDKAEADVNFTPVMAKDELLKIMAKGATPAAGSHVVTMEDETEKARAGVTAALLIRAGLSKNDNTNPFRGYTLAELARASLERLGVKTGGMTKMDMVAAAFTHSGSDFTNILANVAEKSMLKGYEESGETFQQWTSTGVLTDFKAVKRVDLNTFPSLDKVAEGAEFKYATIGDHGEQVQLATYGKLFSITRQAIINDDLSAFSKVPRLMGRAAIRTVGDLVYAILTANPTMSDGVALFHASHANLASSGSAISTANVDAARVAMGTQKDGAATLNIRMAHLIVPLALEGTANVVRDSEFEVGASTKNNTVPNSVRNTFDVIADARLDAASATTWYGAGDANTTDTIEVSYLDGVQTPSLEQQNGWTVDGTEFKVRIDAVAKALSYRALFKNPGA